MIRILIADDHILIREGLKKVLGREKDFQIVAEAANADEILKIIQKIECDVLTLDISMTGKSGIDLLKDLHAGYPSINVLILSIHPEERYAVMALKAGAAGYLTKEASAEELKKAIRKVCKGGKYVSRALAEKLALGLNEGFENPPHAVLSPREFQVMIQLASGKSVKDIAVILNLSVKTISTFRRRILDKMNFHNNAEIIQYAIKKELVT